MGNVKKRGCPDCNPAGTRRGKWLVYVGNTFFYLICPYCKFEIRIHRFCQACGAFSTPLCKHREDKIFHTQDDLSTAPEIAGDTRIELEVDYGTID